MDSARWESTLWAVGVEVIGVKLGAYGHMAARGLDEEAAVKEERKNGCLRASRLMGSIRYPEAANALGAGIGVGRVVRDHPSGLNKMMYQVLEDGHRLIEGGGGEGRKLAVADY